MSEKNSWQQNLIWKNTWPLIFDIMFNTWQIFDKNLQQRSILSHSGRLFFKSGASSLLIQKGNLWRGKERDRWGWKYYEQWGKERGGCWLLSNIFYLYLLYIFIFYLYCGQNNYCYCSKYKFLYFIFVSCK